MLKLLPISIYVHIPWCLKKCGYCDFYSYVSKEIIPEKKYVQNLLKDLETDLLLAPNREIKTIFIGGGTPSLLNPASIKQLIYGIKERISIAKNAEISIEANPKKLEYQRFIEYKNAGINRFSLGIQTFNAKLLKTIERTYDYEEAISAIQESKKNIHNLNLDLMYGLPNQKLEDALLDLQYAIKYNPSHISWYQFTIEPNTVFYAKKIKTIINENTILKISGQGEKLLKQSGYKKYEISSYSKKNYECQHNLNYWNFGDYIGIGCAAHGKITQQNGKIIRTIKNKNINDFLNQKYLHSMYLVSKRDKIFEYFMNVFRLYKPILKKHFRDQTNLDEFIIQKKVQLAVKNGFLVNKLDYWETTQKGKLFLNSLLEIFL